MQQHGSNVIFVVTLGINTIEQTIALKAVERIYQNQWLFSYQQLMFKITLMFLQCGLG